MKITFKSLPDCSVCLEDFSMKDLINRTNIHKSRMELPLLKKMVSDEKIVQLACEHFFHKDCLEDWIKTCENNVLLGNISCPNCKKIIAIKQTAKTKSIQDQKSCKMVLFAASTSFVVTAILASLLNIFNSNE
jgi:hypothetical protein